MVYQLELVRFVKDGFMLAPLLPIVAPHADVVITVEGLLHVLKLPVKHFLRAEEIRSHEVELVTDDLAALGPHLAVEAVVGIFVTDVI